MAKEENNKDNKKTARDDEKSGRANREERGSHDQRLSIRDAFSRFLDDDFWIEPFDIWRSPGRLISRMNRELFPRIDVSETGKEIKVIADVPGVDADNINIEVEGNRMRISGRTDRESENKDGEKPYRYERSYGEFRREFVLPARVKEDEIKARCKDGVLTITLPKEEEEKRKKIKIEKL